MPPQTGDLVICPSESRGQRQSTRQTPGDPTPNDWCLHRSAHLLTSCAGEEIRPVVAPDHPAWAFEASSQVNTLDESSYAGRPPRHKLHDLPQVCIPLKTAVGAFQSAKFIFIWSCFGGVKRRYREYFFIRWRNERYEIPSRSAAFVCTPPL